MAANLADDIVKCNFVNENVLIFIEISLNFVPMVPTGSDELKLRTLQGPFQDQISHYKDFYDEFHNADIPNTPHICGNFLLFSFWDIILT